MTHSFPTRRVSDLAQPGVEVGEEAQILALIEDVLILRLVLVVRAEPAAALAEGAPGRSLRRGRQREQRNQTGIRLVADVEHPGIAERLVARSEEHTSELQSLMRISYAAFCL